MTENRVTSMHCEHHRLIHIATLGAALVAIGACSHVANVLTNTGAALRRHSDESSSNSATQSSPTVGTDQIAAASKEQIDAIATAQRMALEECKASFATPELDPIRHKLEMWREPGDGPLPFEIAADDAFPTSEEKLAIAKWASLRDACLQRFDDLPYIPPGASAVQATMMKQLRAYNHQVNSELTELAISLYQQKLTYGEFGRKRYEIAKAVGTLTLSIQQAGVGTTNGQHLMEELQSAQQQFTDTLDAFSKYVRAVQARKPKTVRVSGAAS